MFPNTRKVSWTYSWNVKFLYWNVKFPIGMLNFLSKFVYKMQLYLKPFYNILRQQNNFEWTTEQQTRFEKSKKVLTEQISNTIPDANQPFYAMCDASNFGIGAALRQSHNGPNKMNLISANSCLLTQAELRLSTLMRECHNKYTIYI